MGRKQTDLSHLQALTDRLSHEQARFAAAKSDGERALRTVWMQQIEREIAQERSFLHQNGSSAATDLVAAMTEIGRAHV